MPDLKRIKTIVLVMMENRSFDHLLGYLSLPPFNRPDVDGLSADPIWRARFANLDQGQPYLPEPSDNPHTMPDKFDPPHERPAVAASLGGFADGAFAMNAFVSAIPADVSADTEVRRWVMRYFGPTQAPITHFFATHFGICNRYFSSLPAGTQANRYMSLCGESPIDLNQTPMPDRRVVYDWLEDRGVRWRVYHEGLPFLALMPRWIGPILTDGEHFRHISRLGPDLINTPPAERPDVIFVEPTYGDAPRFGPSSDDHAPSGISTGQEFLMQVYNAITASPSFWRDCLMVVNYDEHGGFFDHVSPPLIPTAPPADASYPPFRSLGVRTPTYVISPYVRAGSVSQDLFDHVSVLKLLGERFAPDGSYSPVVDARPVQSLSRALNLETPRIDLPVAPALHDYLAGSPARTGEVVLPPAQTALQRAFRDSVQRMKAMGAGRDHPRFGRLLE